ncbi:MAG TPA: tryptophan synthase subunit alpha [Actinobacteria bacterium]|nr:tryptophan synthase subunit alpha [Actinomycetota bacterium]
MRELRRRFERCAAEGRAAFLPYLTAGLPDPDSALTAFEAMAEAGADGFEVGIPYSDPLMDGPVIQEAARRALAAGMDVDRSFELVAGVVDRTGVPVIAMTYVNPVLRRGVARFMADAAAAGASGVIVADLPVDEADPFLDAARDAGVDLALFAAPTTTPERLARIGRARPGFVYAIADLGVTGERDRGSRRIGDLVAEIRRVTDAPVVLGVGITTVDDVRAAARLADGVIVGSALVRRVLEASPRAAIGELGAAVAAYAAACRRAPEKPLHGE